MLLTELGNTSFFTKENPKEKEKILKKFILTFSMDKFSIKKDTTLNRLLFDMNSNNLVITKGEAIWDEDLKEVNFKILSFSKDNKEFISNFLSQFTEKTFLSIEKKLKTNLTLNINVN